MVDDRDSKSRYRADHVKVLVPKDGQGNSYAFVDDREAAEEEDQARWAVATRWTTARVVLTTLPLEAYAEDRRPGHQDAGHA